MTFIHYVHMFLFCLETLNTLFRGNSLATKAVDEFMKVG